MKIGETGVWIRAQSRHHRLDTGLAAALVEYYQTRGGNLLDIGCGDGAYVRHLRAAGIECDGYDGNPDTPVLTGGMCGVADFSQPVSLGLYDWVLSLEVAEHIPPEYESEFIDNLHRHNRRGIVLSWAIPGQGGAGHVNERFNSYVWALLTGLGYQSKSAAERVLRAAITDYCFWFRQSLMVFERT